MLPLANARTVHGQHSADASLAASEAVLAKAVDFVLVVAAFISLSPSKVIDCIKLKTRHPGAVSAIEQGGRTGREGF